MASKYKRLKFFVLREEPILLSQVMPGDVFRREDAEDVWKVARSKAFRCTRDPQTCKCGGKGFEIAAQLLWMAGPPGVNFKKGNSNAKRSLHAKRRVVSSRAANKKARASGANK